LLLIPDTGNFGDNFFCSGFACGAIPIVDAALGQSEVASASAVFGIELVERGLPLLRVEMRQIHAGELAGAVSVSEKNLARVFKRLHSSSNGHA
jgi:hypothetical protein